MAITGTLAWVIRALQIEASPDKALQLAQQWWQQRHQHHRFQEAM